MSKRVAAEQHEHGGTTLALHSSNCCPVWVGEQRTISYANTSTSSLIDVMHKHKPGRKLQEINTKDDICAALIETIDLGFDNTLTCSCGGAPIIFDPSTNVPTTLGIVHINCPSNCFFVSPDDKVWWWLYVQADFDQNGLVRLRQNSHYVKGREKGDTVFEKFTLRYDPDGSLNEDRPCDLRLTRFPNLGGTYCDDCEVLRADDAEGSNTCLRVDCRNTAENLLAGLTDEHAFYIDDTCATLPVTDFVSGPMAASLGYTQSNVNRVCPVGGHVGVLIISEYMGILGDVYCTTSESDEIEGDIFLSCQLPCVYGPEIGNVEYIEYFEGMFGAEGDEKWRQRRYEYNGGRSGYYEIFRSFPNKWWTSGGGTNACKAVVNGTD